MNRLCALLLSLLLASPALANDWLPAERGDRWIDSETVYPAVPAFNDGSATTVGVRRALGGWRLFSDFAGLGPLWVHAGTPNRIYIWNGAFAQVFVDFVISSAPGSR